VTLLQITVVALVQGITEFLPISSQAHLILVPRVTGWCDQGLVVDIGVHFGTLLAVMTYFWRDCLGLGQGFFGLARGRVSAEGHLFLYVTIATLPIVIGGYVLWQTIGLSGTRSMALIGWATVFFGVLLWFADKWGPSARRLEQMTWAKALMVGCAQVLALIPGTSRAGITMTAARMFGFERTEAARFSLLMAIPAILGATLVASVELIKADSAVLTTAVAGAGAISYVAALIAIATMMRWLARSSFTPFVIYRIALGIILLSLVYGFGFGDFPDAGSAAAACI
jgi:undecaprenyl-diphosphatase